MHTDPSPSQYDWLKSVHTRRSIKPDWVRLSYAQKTEALREAARGDQIARARPSLDAMKDWSWERILQDFETP